MQRTCGGPEINPLTLGTGPVTITYTYDPLNRLEDASYSTGEFFTYTYDAAGNRLTETTHLSATLTYGYDIANRLTSVGAQTYTYDNNGNLLSDGVSTYTYDAANRLTAVTQGADAYSFSYNGLGDRLQQTVNAAATNYTVDLNGGLTQVLADGTNSYLYGLGRIGENAGTWAYHLPDALGSVRQITDDAGEVTLANAYEPFGDVLESIGGAANYGFTGEWTDATGLVHLRARYLNTGIGRFISKDMWAGDYNRPLSLNRWNYVESNPVNFTDPSGQCIFTGVDTVACLIALAVGIPAIAGVTTAAYDFAVTQGGGLGGVNQNNQDCIDWVQVLDAGKGGFFGAIDSEATLIASIPLAPLYLVSAIVYQKSPVEVNATLLSHFGLDDEYSAAYSNPYYVAGKGGGSAAGTYISLATFLKGLPTIVGNFGNKIGKGGVLVLSVEGMSVVGGSGELVYVGTAGFSASFFSLGPENKAQGQWGEAQARELLEKSGLEILGEEVNIQVSGGRRIVDFLVRDSKGKIYAVEVKTGNAQLTQHQITLDNLMRTQGGVIRSQKVPVEFNNLRLDSIEMIYFRFPNPP